MTRRDGVRSIRNPSPACGGGRGPRHGAGGWGLDRNQPSKEPPPQPSPASRGGGGGRALDRNQPSKEPPPQPSPASRGGSYLTKPGAPALSTPGHQNSLSYSSFPLSRG